MQRISSSWTVISKRVFPLLFFGFLAFFVYDSYRSGAFEHDPLFMVGPIFMVGIGAFVIKLFVADLADEVIDHGTFLQVRRGSVTENIYLSNIMNVSASQFVNPPRITLRLVQPGQLGREVAFSPKVGFSLNPLAKPEIAEQLMERAYRARQQSAA